MKKFLLVFCLLLFTVKIFAQQFSQYNTGTLYDSFENPSQKSFITDSSKQYASNFLIPNFNTNFFVSGDAQASLKSRAFLYKYNNSALKIDQGKYNHIGAGANIYLLTFKMFHSFKGDTEMGFSWQMRAEGRGLVSDETIGLLNGTSIFTNDYYNNIFNDNVLYQAYHQFSFNYREQVTKRFALGFKISALLGIQYRQITIDHSYIAFNKVADSASVGLRGTYYNSYIPGNNLVVRDFLPTFRSPGAAISIGTSYHTEDNFTIQANVKDLGFIHWSKLSRGYFYNNTAGFYKLSGSAREDSIYNGLNRVIHNGGKVGSFIKPINARAELSVNKSFWIDGDHQFKYSPTLIGSKELFYKGFIGALVNPFQYRKYILTFTTTYDELKLFTLGTQFMVKTQNFEFYIGSDKIAQTANLLSDARTLNQTAINKNTSFTGADFFLGFSLKFGPVTEHPMNASVIPTGEKGFFGRFFGRLFKTND
jgi:hypothetical protein